VRHQTPPYLQIITCKTDATTNRRHEGFSLTAHLAGCAAVAVTAAFPAVTATDHRCAKAAK
jgi:hypothetical protein